jgi:peptide/nickel transport system permease protein
MSVISPANLRRIGSQPRLATGLVITLLIALVAIFGPLFAPYGENEIVGRPYTREGSWLGTDYLGHDVWSRVLYGGLAILIIAVLATALGMALGIIIGVVAAYWGGWLDEAIMRLNDVALAFPQILLVLLVLTAVDQPAWWMIVLLVGASHAPRVARLARGVALGLVSRDYVAAAEALGESRLRVILAEVLPNMSAPLLAEAGLRLTYRSRRGHRLPGLRHQPQRGRLGRDDLREPTGAVGPALGNAGAGDHHRCLHHRHQSDGRRHRAADRQG